MHQLLCDHHDVFVLSEGECGETDLIQMDIETGDANNTLAGCHTQLEKKWQGS